jgi:hypothetical protein
LERIRGRSASFVSCPGNHDVNWGLIKADPEARHLASAPYVSFRNAISSASHYGADTPPERLYEIAHIDGSPSLLLVSLNSAAIEGPVDHRGYIGESQLDNALAEAKSHPKWSESVRVAMFHHHLLPVSSIEAVIAAESLLADAAMVKKRLLSEGFSLVVHGHRHHAHAELTSDGTNSMVVVGCGSSGVGRSERGEQPLQFNRIFVQKSSGSETIQLVTYEFNASDRMWRKSTASPQKTFKTKS